MLLAAGTWRSCGSGPAHEDSSEDLRCCNREVCVHCAAGVTTQADLQCASPDELPDYVVPSIAALAGLE